MIDVDGGIGTMLVIASKGRREMPNAHVYVDGQVEQLSRSGQFVGQHIAPRNWVSPFTSMRSISPFGACWKKWRPRFWRGCP